MSDNTSHDTPDEHSAAVQPAGIVPPGLVGGPHEDRRPSLNLGRRRLRRRPESFVTGSRYRHLGLTLGCNRSLPAPDSRRVPAA